VWALTLHPFLAGFLDHIRDRWNPRQKPVFEQVANLGSNRLRVRQVLTDAHPGILRFVTYSH
jgi:hypothetical protein